MKTVKVLSTKHRDLLVTNPKVRFVDGQADVTRAQADQLRPIADEFGLQIPDGGEKDGQAEAAQPAKKRPKHAK